MPGAGRHPSVTHSKYQCPGGTFCYYHKRQFRVSRETRLTFLEARFLDEISYPAAEVKTGPHFQSAMFFGAHGSWGGITAVGLGYWCREKEQASPTHLHLE